MSKLFEGYYKANDHFYRVLKHQDGNSVTSDAVGNEYPVTIEYGQFGEADPEVEKISGMKCYNVKMTIHMPGSEKEAESEKKKMEICDLGVIYDNGKRCSMKGFTGRSSLEKITEVELEEIMNDFDPIEAPPGPYTIQPGKKGKIIWLTGAPGMGKSTTAQLLAKNHGYVYYEADCFMGLKNPYVPLDSDNPSMAQLYQKVLKGPGMEERQSVVKNFQVVFGDLMAGNQCDKEGLFTFYRHMAADIKREQKRIGGDFAIANILPSAELRALMRSLLGSSLIIVVLTMSTADRRARVLARHGGDASATDLMDHFEKLMENVQEDEPNTIDMRVDSSMSKEEVVAEVFLKIEEVTENK